MFENKLVFTIFNKIFSEQVMKLRNKIFLLVVGVLLIIQLPVFRPAKNFTDAEPVNDIAKAYDVPMDIQMHIYDGCYSCHSNYTEKYFWYYNIQPVSWWMASHIRNAKRELNFSEFATYSPQSALKKFEEIEKVMVRKSMPLKSYTLTHKEARFTDEDFHDVAEWARGMQKELSQKKETPSAPE
ncbi:MAG: hypothetical protein BWX95_02427 [Bacteroidetes bacterium ADurb.Bin141]|nr:cytochrome C [Bacteroidetes bacterium CHB6]OQB59984.1 MAG: hypothetical protein BWX95_02427 [Bacteroidetes bacterium ADurb.Bin141]